MGQDTTFATLIGSRICHDLISPIGAINNGLELMEMGAATVSPEMALINQSVNSANARIRFFRIAFGAAGEQMISCAEVTSILDGIYTGSRLLVAWGSADGQQRRVVRLALLALLCLETGMPYGGRVRIDVTDGVVRLTGEADKLNIDADLWAKLEQAGSCAQLIPSQVQFGLLPVIAADEDRTLRVTLEATRIVILV